MGLGAPASDAQRRANARSTTNTEQQAAHNTLSLSYKLVLIYVHYSGSRRTLLAQGMIYFIIQLGFIKSAMVFLIISSGITSLKLGGRETRNASIFCLLSASAHARNAMGSVGSSGNVPGNCQIISNVAILK